MEAVTRAKDEPSSISSRPPPDLTADTAQMTPAKHESRSSAARLDEDPASSRSRRRTLLVDIGGGVGRIEETPPKAAAQKRMPVRTDPASSRKSILSKRVESVEAFQGCSAAFRKELAKIADIKIFKSNTIVYNVGDSVDVFYILNAGQIEVLDGVEKKASSSLAGDSIFGEHAALLSEGEDWPSPSIVRTKTFCVCRAITRKNILEVLDTFPEDAAAFRDLIEARLSEHKGRTLLSARASVTVQFKNSLKRMTQSFTSLKNKLFRSTTLTETNHQSGSDGANLEQDVDSEDHVVQIDKQSNVYRKMGSIWRVVSANVKLSHCSRRRVFSKQQEDAVHCEERKIFEGLFSTGVPGIPERLISNASLGARYFKFNNVIPVPEPCGWDGSSNSGLSDDEDEEHIPVNTADSHDLITPFAIQERESTGQARRHFVVGRKEVEDDNSVSSLLGDDVDVMSVNSSDFAPRA